MAPRSRHTKKSKKRDATSRKHPSQKESKKPRKADSQDCNDASNTRQDDHKDTEKVVIQRFIQYNDDQTVPSISLTPDLDTLLYPIKGSYFLEHCLRQRAVHITCQPGKEQDHSAARIQQICHEMFDLDPRQILQETSSDNIFLWLHNKNSSSNSRQQKTSQGLIQSVEISDVDTAIALHQTGGHATYCRAPPKVEQNLVSSLLRATGLGCGQYDPSGESLTTLGRGEVETFISTTRHHVTNWHYDFQENFTIQLSGIKRWTLQQGTISDPIRGCTPHYAAPEAVESQLKAAHLHTRSFEFGHPTTNVNATGKVVSVDVKPGDVFYFPAGMWHKVETIEPGVSINVSLMTTNYATVVGQAIQHYLLQFPQWRTPIMNHGHSINNGTATSTNGNVMQHLNSLLKELPTTLQGFSRGEFVIPPVLQYPPKFQAFDQDFEEEEDSEHEQNTNNKGTSEDDDNNEKEIDDSESDGNQQSDDSDYSTNSQDEMDNDDIDDNIVNPLEFDNYPIEWNVEIPTKGQLEELLQRNPIATLHRMDEISGFYNQHTNHDDFANRTFVLNVNYAGNEMHQSAVRVVFLDSSPSGCVQKIYEFFEKKKQQEKPLNMTREDVPFVKFLIFHGYLTL